MDFSQIFKFLQTLSKNNDRNWFEKNKGTYLQAKENFDAFVSAFLKPNKNPIKNPHLGGFDGCYWTTLNRYLVPGTGIEPVHSKSERF